MFMGKMTIALKTAQENKGVTAISCDSRRAGWVKSSMRIYKLKNCKKNGTRALNKKFKRGNKKTPQCIPSRGTKNYPPESAQKKKLANRDTFFGYWGGKRGSAGKIPVHRSEGETIGWYHGKGTQGGPLSYREEGSYGL